MVRVSIVHPEGARRKTRFNLIHLPTSFKVDVFVSRQRPFDITAMNRATMESLGSRAKIT